MLAKTLPDVTSDSLAENSLALQWVGMEGIAIPITINAQDNRLITLPAKANVYVSLDNPEAKGIHMSRLHGALNQFATQECDKDLVKKLLDEAVENQKNIGNQAKLELSFDLILEKPALLSDETGFQSYKVTINAEKTEQGLYCEFEFNIPYSSTCPCSASLARQLYANAVDKHFNDATISKSELLDWIQSQAGSVATPHSQRSYATIKVALNDNDWPNLSAFIFELEDIIRTPVQTAVKRVDEQEFARLNAENLIFCEDSARRIKSALEAMRFVENYWIKIDHQESLHAHNAVVIDQKYRDKKHMR